MSNSLLYNPDPGIKEVWAMAEELLQNHASLDDCLCQAEAMIAFGILLPSTEEADTMITWPVRWGVYHD
jgi:hypothetical protein